MLAHAAGPFQPCCQRTTVAPICQSSSYNRPMVEDLVRSVSFRVGDSLYEAMRKAAEDDNRSLSNWIETVLKRELERRARDSEPDDNR